MRSRLPVLVMALLLALAGCGAKDDPMASHVTIRDQWSNAADMGMVAVFGTLTNDGDREVRIVSGTSPAARRVEMHQVVGNVMQPIAGGLVIPAGTSHELRPGGDHVMLMDLTQPLQPGADVTVTLTFEDGSTLPVTAQVRDFPGAGEVYRPAPVHG